MRNAEFKHNPRTVGLITLIISAAITLLIFSDIYRKPFESKTQTVKVDFERAPQLYPGDEVRLEGDIDGKVKSVEPSPDDANQARAVLEVDKAAGPIYANATVQMKALTLLGGKYYVAIDRGSKDAGPLGSKVIPVERSHVQVELEDFTDAFRNDALSGFQALPGETAKALGDPSAPGQAVQNFNVHTNDLKDATEAAQGLEPGYSLPHLILSSSKVVAALDTGDDDLRTLVSGAASTLQVTANRDRDIQQAIEVTPRLAQNLTTTLTRLETTADIFNTTTRKLTSSVSRLAPTLQGLRPALVQFRNIIPTLPRLFTDADTLFKTLYDIPVATKTLKDLEPSLRMLDNTVLPYLNKPDPGTGVPTTTMIGGAAAGLAGIASLQDENGHYVRFPASGGPTTVYLPCSSSIIDANASSLLACDSLDSALQNYLGYFPPGPPNSRSAKSASKGKGSK